MYFDEVAALAQHFISANILEQQLLQSFEPNFLTQDGTALFAEFSRISAKWFLPKTLGINKLTKSLNAYAKTLVNKENIHIHITALRDYQQESKAAADLLLKYGQDLGAFYNGKDTDWNKISQLAAKARNDAQALYALEGSYNLMHNHCGNSKLCETIYGLWNNFDTFTEAKTAFDNLLDIVQKTEDNWLDGQIILCETILSHADELKEWIAYAAVAADAKAMGLGNVVSGHENVADHDDIYRSYRKSMLQGLISDAIDETVLAGKSSAFGAWTGGTTVTKN